MNKHTSPETLISTCKATTRLMRSNHNLESFNKEGVIPALSHVIKTAKGNVSPSFAPFSDALLIAVASRACVQVDVIAAAAGTLSRVAVSPAHSPPLASRVGLCSVQDDSKAAQAIMDTGCVAEILACLKSNPDNKELVRPLRSCPPVSRVAVLTC